MLSKLPLSTYIPAVRGVTALPERTVCTPRPPEDPGGYWTQICGFVQVIVGYVSDDALDQGGVTGNVGDPIYMSVYVCRSEWVSNVI